MLNAAALAYCVGGGLILYSGIKGATLADTVSSVLSGNLTLKNSEPITTSNGSSPVTDTTIVNPASNTASANQALAKQLAIKLGHSDWTTGPQWAAWVKLWNQESNWSITAANPNSNARGIAQNINGYNNTDYKQGDAVSQITWGINYIAQDYPMGPVQAWQHEVMAGWY